MREELCCKLGNKETLGKLLNHFLLLTTPNEVKKHLELLNKTEAKVMMHTNISDDCAHYYNINILNPFHPESQ